MKKIAFAAASLALTFLGSVYAAGGPPLSTLVEATDNQFDLSSKTQVSTGEVYNTLQKSQYFRTIYSVKERQREPKTVFIVEETGQKMVPQDESKFVIVNKQNAAGWVYLNK